MNTPQEIPAGMMLDLANFEGGKYAELAYTKEEANRLAELFKQIGGFEVRTPTKGSSDYGPRGHDVELWSTNATAGNRNLFQVPLESGIDLKRAKQIAKEAKNRFSGSDKKAFNRMAAERQMDRE